MKVLNRLSLKNLLLNKKRSIGTLIGITLSVSLICAVSGMFIMNEIPYFWCERVFAPWVDMEEEMRREDVPLYALESGDPVSDFDFIGFTLQYELSYTNVLNMLELAGIDVYKRQARRKSWNS